MNPNPEKGIECYVDADFSGGWNQEEGKDPGLVLSRTGYIISYANCLIILVRRLQIEIALSTTEVEYIDLSEAMRNVLPFVSLMKKMGSYSNFKETLRRYCVVFSKNQ